MSKQELVKTIGKLVVDKQFRDKYFNNFDQVLDSIPDLSDSEKQFLREKNDAIRQAITEMSMDIEYEGEDKRN